ncbi:MAG TPA: dihydrodipicolinate reductase C-terminal domain-containing protein [Tepidisphaeraceae bacterium]|nr:dihydrodipicolinate reductase C-terminal domain-containing protein [Tepidisphaeraceae bacterium]
MRKGPLKIALLGYGAMGQLIADRARAAGHTVGLTVTSSHRPADATLVQQLALADVAIDFSSAGAVLANVTACAAAGRPIVVGTTGWAADFDQSKLIIDRAGGAMVFGANFSVGVNVFYRVAEVASRMFAAVEGYEPLIEEQHHSRKKDAPSGTAVKLKHIVERAVKRRIDVASTRAGHIPGTHRVGFDSRVDQVLLTHTARNREGFADGAVLAAGWIVGKTGVFEFDHIMDDILPKEVS